MRLAIAVGLLTTAVTAEDAEPGLTWTGRVRLSLDPEQIATGLAKEPAEARAAVEKLVFGDWIDTKICSISSQVQITYRNFDEDSFDEAILATGSHCNYDVLLILDRDQSGWWLVGRRAEDRRRGEPSFRIMNWPGESGPISIVVHGTRDSGSEVSGHGITVFRLARSTLRVVFQCETSGYRGRSWLGLDPPRSQYRDTFFKTSSAGLIVARRAVLLPDDDAPRNPKPEEYQHGTVTCEEHRWDPVRQIYRRPTPLPASACANVWTSLASPFGF